MNFFWIHRQLLFDQTSAWQQITGPAKKKKNNNPGSCHGLGFAIQCPRDTTHRLGERALGHREEKALTNPSANEASLKKKQDCYFLGSTTLSQGTQLDGNGSQRRHKHRGSPDSTAEHWHGAFRTGRFSLKTSNGFLRTVGFCGLVLVVFGFFLLQGY